MSIAAAASMVRQDDGWERDAACGSEPPELWTAAAGPRVTEVDAYQREICLSCPVFARCARFAVENRLDSEFRAGVRIPTKHVPARWLAAMTALAQVAGLPAPVSVSDKPVKPVAKEADLDAQILAARYAARLQDPADQDGVDEEFDELDEPSEWDLDREWGAAS